MLSLVWFPMKKTIFFHLSIYLFLKQFLVVTYLLVFLFALILTANRRTCDSKWSRIYYWTWWSHTITIRWPNAKKFTCNHSHMKRNSLDTRVVFTEFSEYGNNSGRVVYWSDRSFSRSSRLSMEFNKFWHFNITNSNCDNRTIWS